MLLITILIIDMIAEDRRRSQQFSAWEAFAFRSGRQRSTVCG